MNICEIGVASGCKAPFLKLLDDNPDVAHQFTLKAFIQVDK